MNTIDNLEKVIHSKKVISTPSSRYVLSTIWLTKHSLNLPEKEFRELFYNVTMFFYHSGYPGLSFIYLMTDSNLNKSIKDLFQTYGLEMGFWETGKGEEEVIDETLLSNLLEKGNWLHSLFICAVSLLINSNSRISVSYLNGLEKPETNWIKPQSFEIQRRRASSERAELVAAEMIIKGTGYYAGDALMRDTIMDVGKLDFIEERIINAKEIDFKGKILLTGNGFSKYITSKYLGDNWLTESTNFSDMRSKMIERVIDQKNKTIEMFGSPMNPEINDSLKWYDVQIRYIKSNKMIMDIVTFLERFLGAQQEFMAWYNKKQIEHIQIKVNGDNSDFHNFLKSLNIPEFDHKNRDTLIHIMMYISTYDLFHNVEAYLSVIDKFTKNHSNEKSDMEPDLAYVLNYVYAEAFIEKVWNNGKAYKKIPEFNAVHGFSEILSLNYDNFTDQIFGETIHLHGCFDVVAPFDEQEFLKQARRGENIYEKKWKTKKIILSQKNYFEQIENARSSVVLKGGDYKMRHLAAVGDNVMDYGYLEKNQYLSGMDNDILVIGSLIMGDPHILDVIGNKERIVYLTIFDESEEWKLSSLLLINSLTNRKATYKFVKFKDLMNEMGL